MYFGIDIGGTSVKYAVVNQQNEIVHGGAFATIKDSDTALLDKIIQVINENNANFSFDSVGIGSPGYVDSKNGIIAGSKNTPFKNTPAREYLSRYTDKKIYLDNDANCAALAEYSENGGKKNLVLLTLGTGIGGGIIIDGKLYRGSSGFAGELGHMVICSGGRKCGCGQRGCFEQYASATALVRMTKRAVSQKTPLFENEEMLIDGKSIDKRIIDGRTVFEAYRSKSKLAEKILNRYMAYLADGISSYCNIFDPDEVVLAGGITNEADVFMELLSPHIKGISCREGFNVRISRLTKNAGVIGAALLTAQHCSR